MQKKEKKVTIQNKVTPFGLNISKDEKERLSLTDIWRVSGANEDMRPNDWLNYDQTKFFIEGICSVLNTVPSGIIKTKKGKGGGTFGHKQIALAYAKYLSPKLHIAVNEIFFERLEEEKNPDKITDRAIETYRKFGKSDSWILERVKGKVARKEFTATLASHLVKGAEGYKACTNGIYKHLWGGGADVVRAKKQLEEKENTREHMTDIELAAVRIAELMAKQNIEKHNLYGNIQCSRACEISSLAIGQALKNNENNYKK